VLREAGADTFKFETVPVEGPRPVARSYHATATFGLCFVFVFVFVFVLYLYLYLYFYWICIVV
jgi:hypothetical protein